MSIFTSQFDRARAYSLPYAGPSDDPGWRTPAAAAAAIAAGGLAVVTAVAAGAALADTVDVDAVENAGAGPAEAADGAQAAAGWGEGWDAGWDAQAPVASIDQVTGDDGAWIARGDYTDAGVGGDGDFLYFIDGDSSLTIG